MAAKAKLKEFERHPLSAMYADIIGQDWIRFSDGFKERGYQGNAILLWQGKILDGWQRYRACVEHDIIPPMTELEMNELEAELLIESLNDNRRQLTPEVVQRHIATRRHRVADLRAKGLSTRAIAEEVGASQATVRRDIENSGESCGSPETPDGKVTGTDGKKQAARKKRTPSDSKSVKEPKYCVHCTRKGKPCCPKCIAKMHKYNEAKKAEATAETKPERDDGIDFVAGQFDNMRSAVAELVTLAKAAAAHREEPGCADYNAVYCMTIEIETLINKWHKRVKEEVDRENYKPTGNGTYGSDSERR